MDESNSKKTKTRAEIFLLPLVIAVVGGIATFVVAYFQSESTTEIEENRVRSFHTI